MLVIFMNLHNLKLIKLLLNKPQYFNKQFSMRIGWIQKVVNKWPGKRTFGMYRFLPMFFVLGAALEFSMINWKVGKVNFYTTFKRRQAHEIVEEKIRKYSATS